MTIPTLHVPQKDSPQSTLATGVNDSVTTLVLADSSIFETAGVTRLTLGLDQSNTETVTVTNYDGNNEITDNNTPPHYQGTIQPINLINAQNLNFNLGNVVKYVCRSGKKEGENTLSDLEKAKDYINFEIERVKK